MEQRPPPPFHRSSKALPQTVRLSTYCCPAGEAAELDLVYHRRLRDTESEDACHQVEKTQQQILRQAGVSATLTSSSSFWRLLIARVPKPKTQAARRVLCTVCGTARRVFSYSGDAIRVVAVNGFSGAGPYIVRQAVLRRLMVRVYCVV